MIQGKFKVLVDAMKFHDLYQHDDEVGIALNDLELAIELKHGLSDDTESKLENIMNANHSFTKDEILEKLIEEKDVIHLNGLDFVKGREVQNFFINTVKKDLAYLGNIYHEDIARICGYNLDKIEKLFNEGKFEDIGVLALESGKADKLLINYIENNGEINTYQEYFGDFEKITLANQVVYIFTEIE